MPDQEPHASPVPLGVFDRPRKRAISGSEVIALVLSLIWLAGCAAFFLVLGGGVREEAPAQGLSANPLQFVLTILAVFMPVAIIWVAAAAARSARIMREESARLQAAIDGMRHTYLQHQQSAGLGQAATKVEQKLEEIARAQRLTESAIATFTSSRANRDKVLKTTPPAPRAAPRPESDEVQPSLSLGTDAEELAPPLPMEDFIRAMHFPENPDDQEGFRALRRALRDHKVAGLVRAAQDVLTLLSQDGIYMDDLRPDMARPEIWRKFAKGERGRAIAALGGIRDRSSLALSAGRMRTDPVFRDAVHHFLRRFDRVYADFEAEATDEDIARMADTRTARAFMLLGRVTGTFD